MNCPFCGSVLENGAQFCGSCGNQANAFYASNPEATVQQPKKISIGARILSVFLAFLLIITVFTSISAAIIGKAISVDNISDVINEIRVVEVFDIVGVDMGTFGVPQEYMQEVYEETGLDEVLDFGEIFACFLLGEEMDVPSGKEIADTIYDNRELVEDISGYRMTYEDYVKLLTYFEVGDGGEMLDSLSNPRRFENAKEFLVDLSPELRATLEMLDTFRDIVKACPTIAVVTALISLLLVAVRFLLVKFKSGSLIVSGVWISLVSMFFLFGVSFAEICIDMIDVPILSDILRTTVSSFSDVSPMYLIAGLLLIAAAVVMIVVKKAVKR